MRGEQKKSTTETIGKKREEGGETQRNEEKFIRGYSVIGNV